MLDPWGKEDGVSHPDQVQIEQRTLIWETSLSAQTTQRSYNQGISLGFSCGGW